MGTKQSVPEDASSSPDARLPESANRFMCQFQNGAYTVMYQPESQPGTFYPWATPQAMGGGWSEDRRCAEISRRLEEYRPDGLQELRTSVENGYDIVCATTELNPRCRIVFTVPQGQDPVMTRDRVFENLAVANSRQSTDAVNTFTGQNGSRFLDALGREFGITLPSLPGIDAPSRNTSSNGIDLRPFLDPADGGTGAQIR
ncbi:MAG: COP23 domain-containing protein [Leptolyngbyaceae bacterium]|nr:COP23 domain-containing protein [Leptolyngbyaceae bacterium]